MLTYLLLASGFFALILGAHWLVDGASSIAKRFKISNLVIGLTVVAFGTSSPELFVNLIAAFRGSTDIAIGNIIGSNIFNVFFILGISAIIYPLTVHSNTVWKEIPMSLLAAVLIGISANDKIIDRASYSAITRSDGLAFIAFFIIFMYYTYGVARQGNNAGHVEVKELSALKSTVFILIGLTALVVGSDWIVSGAVSIAKALGVSETTIGLTIVAAGTSLPELATSAVAAYKRNADIAVGNIVGSNIFNAFFILGLSSVIREIPFDPSQNLSVGMNVLASMLLFLFVFVGRGRQIDRREGVLFVMIYILYISYLVYTS
jgi:cation:H+ antiporter